MNTETSLCPFTLTEYRSLVRLAKQRFRFCAFDRFAGEHAIIWRHDVEYSLQEMDNIARIDIEEGIVATMYVQVRSPFYNALSDRARQLFATWLAGGLRIGLHFDWEFIRDDFGNLERYLTADRKVLEALLGVPVTSFSYHNPTDVVLAYKDDMAGMINAYHPRFFNDEGVRYISDSNGRWRDRNLREVLSDESITKLQVNIHDTWWTEDRVPQVDKITNAFLAEAEWKTQFYRNGANIIVDWVI